MKDDWKNKLYFGDNLDIMQNYVPDESVDLIYLDPPFNSKATYNMLFQEKNGTQSRAQITAFDDTWHWGNESESAYHEIITGDQAPEALRKLIGSLREFLGTNDMMAYLVMMSIRLVEMYRVLKPTGSIYLHCDPTASHYLKLVMDATFGAKNYLNEIVWVYKTGGRAKKFYSRKHDIIFFYRKKEQKFNFGEIGVLRGDVTEHHMKKNVDESGRTYWSIKSNGKVYKYYEDDLMTPSDTWTDISHMQQKDPERLGYPTQKPEALLERIIKASSNVGDIVLDPFCGCGTTLVAAERLNRRWIGIDITHLAVSLMKHRLEDTFGSELSAYEVIGDPKDLHGAEALAETNRYQFEWWALGLVGARPAQDKKKGADTGIDGILYFIDDLGKTKKIVVQVKSGHITRSQIATLNSDREREKAEIGVFVTLKEPTRPMKEEAASAGFYVPERASERFPRIQIVTIKELLDGKQIQYPRWHGSDATFKKATRKGKAKEPEQLDL